MNRDVFVCCPGHSGSTLLDLLLGSHSRMHSLGEVIQLPKNVALNTRCMCGARVRECDFWTAVLRRMSAAVKRDLFADPYAVDLGFPKARTIIDTGHQTPRYLIARKIRLGLSYLEQRWEVSLPGTGAFRRGIDHSFLLYDAARELTSAEVVVDSSKSYLRAVAAYRRRPEQVRLLVLMRDGRGVMHSHLKRRLPRREGVNGWRRYYERALPLFDRGVRPEHRMFLRYEELTEQPEAQLDRVCHFLGLPFEPSMIDFRSHAHHIANGNDMRFGESSTIRRDDGWKVGLKAADRAYFERKAGRLNRELGYR